MEITVKKRPRGDTVRPAISIPNDIWNKFKLTYTNKSVRDDVVSKLLIEQLNNELVIVELNTV